ncbi:MAG TPA: hypothetical protein VGK58_23820 [Lacipirellulaceae bacterium]
MLTLEFNVNVVTSLDEFWHAIAIVWREILDIDGNTLSAFCGKQRLPLVFLFCGFGGGRFRRACMFLGLKLGTTLFTALHFRNA